MFRNILAAALRNLARNRLYAAISVLSLAIGMAAALLTFLYVRDELTFDHFVPGYQRVYVVRTNAFMSGRGPLHQNSTPPQLAVWMKTDVPEAGTIARLWQASVALRRGAVEASETVNWADPEIFDILPLPVAAGDLHEALRRPDGLVLTRRAARRYFGNDTPIGQTLEINRKTVLTVTAVLEDLPSNTNLDGEVFASALSSSSPIWRSDRAPYVDGVYLSNVRTYVRLADPAAALRIEARLPQIVHQRMYRTSPSKETEFARSLVLTLAPLGGLHLMPKTGNQQVANGNVTVLWALSSIAVLVLLAAGVNFVNLSTARAARRSLEVGVRKASGADQRQLTVQFLGEALIHSAAAMGLAVMAVELLLPAMNGLFQRRIPFHYWSDPALIGLMTGLTLLTGVLAGLYPALVLSGFEPVTAFKPGATGAGGSALARQGLVVAQFAILIALILSVMVIGRQTWFMMARATGLDTNQVLRINAACKGAFVERLQRLPGVEGMACSSSYAGGVGELSNLALRPDGSQMSVDIAPIDYGFFRFYGVRAVAGRLAQPDHGDEGLPFDAPSGWAEGNYNGRLPTAVVINRAMVTSLGARSPAEAVGRTFRINPAGKSSMTLRVIGVVPNFAYDLTRGAVPPTFYPVVQDASEMIAVRLRAGRIPETLSAIDAAWRDVGEPRLLRKRFVEDFLNLIYAEVIRQAWLIGALAAVAAFISALGLFGLAAFVAEQRTKEIGVRKALGASTPDVLTLLVWQFTQPVLWANLMAWPVAWWALDRWLRGFSSRIALEPWLFLAAAGAALLIAVLTVCGHALRVAAARPVSALRYE